MQAIFPHFPSTLVIIYLLKIAEHWKIKSKTGKFLYVVCDYTIKMFY